MKALKGGKFLLAVPIWVLFLLSSSLIAQPQESYDYTPTAMKRCNNGKCTLVLYSNTRFIYEDNEWRVLEDARDLMPLVSDGKISKVYQSNDGVTDIIIEDFNYTYIRFSFTTTENGNPSYPIKLDGIVLVDVTPRKDTYEMMFLDGTSVFDHNYTIGSDSTTITLSTADSQNMDDTYTEETDADADNGASTNIDYMGLEGDHNYGFYRWNISDIPASQDITDAQLSLYIFSNTYDNSNEGIYMNPHMIFENFTWDESVTWNTQPDSTYYNVTNCSSTMIDGNTPETTYMNFTVTDIVSISYDLGYINASIFMRTIGFAGGSNDMFYTYSKEQTGTATDPILYITYQEEPSDTCSCPGSDTNWEVDMTDDCSVTESCDIGTGNLTFINTGTFTCGTTISVNNMDDPDTDQTVYIDSGCNLYVG